MPKSCKAFLGKMEKRVSTSSLYEDTRNGGVQASAKFQIGDVVVVKEGNVVASHWPITVKTNTGTDKLVRVVTLKTKVGMY